MVKEKPILFSGPMVRAILEGRKTQTRRLVKPQGAHMFPMLNQDKTPRGDWFISDPAFERVGSSGYFPNFRIGDRLWVRETMKWSREGAYAGHELTMRYVADNRCADMEAMPEDYCPPLNGSYTDHWGSGDDSLPEGAQWGFTTTYGICPSIFMPRWASRITLEVTEVRAERLQDITEEDAKAEGAQPWPHDPQQRMTTGELGIEQPFRGGFACLWDDINEDRATWLSNPWVWTYIFKRLRDA